MLEDYVAFYLQKYLGKYVKGVSKETLKISAWKGDVELTNMQLKPEALLELKLPIKVKAGFLGSVKLRVPWSRLGQEPVIVYLDRIFVLAEPSFKVEGADDAAVQDARYQYIKEAETAFVTSMQEQTQQPEMNQSWIGSLIGTIISNIKLSVTNVHIRFEDTESNPEQPFAVGVTLEKIAAVTVDENGKEIFVTGGSLDKINKSGELKRLAVYFDDKAKTWDLDWEKLTPEDWSKVFEPGIREPAGDDESGGKHSYLIQPVDGMARYIKMGTQEERNSEKPSQSAIVTLEDVTLCFSEPQYRDTLKLIDNISSFNMRVQHAHHRPAVTISENPRAWWQYCIKATSENLRKASGHLNWEQLLRHARLRKDYVSKYAKVLLANPKSMSVNNDEEIRKLERELDKDVIVQWRTMSHSLAQQAKQQQAEREKEQQPKRSWWWFGWGGNSDGESEPRGLSEEEWKQLNQAIGYQEGQPSSLIPGQDSSANLHTVLKVEMCHNATKLLSETGQELLNLSCEGLRCNIKLYSEEQDFELKLECYRISSPEGLLGESANDLDALSANFSYFSGNEELDWSLSAEASPCYITYYKASIDRVVKFFSSRPAVSREVQLQTAAAFQMTLDEVARKTQQQFNEALKNKPRFSLLLDIAAPKITVPTDFCPKRSLKTKLMVDLGHFKMKTQKGEDQRVSREESELYMCFGMQLIDVSAFLVDGECNWDAVHSPSVDNVNILPVVDKCAVFASLQQIFAAHPMYPNTRIAVSVPSVAIHFSPARYHRLMQVVNMVQGSSDDDSSARPWEPSDFEGDISVLSWKGIGNREAVWNHRFGALSGPFLYILDSTSASSYEHCVSLIGKQLFMIPPETVGNVNHVVAICDPGQFNKKIVESVSALILRFKDEETLNNWRVHLSAVIHKISSSQAAVKGKLEKSPSQAKEGFVEEKETIFLAGVLDQLKICIGTNKNGEVSVEQVLLGEEVSLLEFRAVGSKVEFVMRENDMGVGAALLSLEIEDKWYGETSPSCQFLARSTVMASSSKRSKAMLIRDDSPSERFFDSADEFEEPQSPEAATRNGNHLSRRTSSQFYDADTSFNENEQPSPFARKPDLLPNLDEQKLAPGKDRGHRNFIKAQVILSSPEAPHYANIDKQVKVSLATLSFYLNRPTLVALLDFVNAINIDVESSSSSGSVSPESSEDQKDDESQDVVSLITPANVHQTGSVPVFDRNDSVVKGLLGTGKSRVIFLLVLDMDRAQFVLNHDDGEQLATLSQDNLRATIKIFPSSYAIVATLGNLRITDDSLHDKHPYYFLCDMRDPAGKSFVELEFVSYNEDDDDYEGYEFSLSGQLSEVRVVYLNRFIQEISSYFLGLVPADTGYLVSLRDKVSDAEKTFTQSEFQGSPAMKLSLSLNKPIVVFPKDTNSNSFLELDVLHISVVNTFQWLGGKKEDLEGVRLETISLKVEDIHLVAAVHGRAGENIIKDSSGLLVVVRRTLRDLRHQLPAIDASVEVQLLKAALSDKEYQLIIDCCTSNLAEAPKLSPPVMAKESNESKAEEEEKKPDENEESSDQSNSSEKEVWTTLKLTVDVSMVELAVLVGRTENTPLASIQICGVWAAYRMSTNEEMYVMASLDTLSVTDDRNGIDPELKFMVGKVDDSLENQNDRDANSRLVMMVLDARMTPSSQMITLRVQRPRVLLALDFLLALAEVFVPSIADMLPSNKSADQLPHDMKHWLFLRKATHFQEAEEIVLSPKYVLVADDERVNSYIYDGGGGRIRLTDSRGGPAGDRLESPLIIVGHGKTLRFKNLVIENASCLDRLILLGSNSSYSISERDGVYLDCRQKATSEVGSQKVEEASKKGNSPEIIFDLQAIGPELVMHTASGHSFELKDRLLCAKMDVMSRLVMKGDDLELTADLKSLSVQGRRGLYVLEPVDASCKYSKVSTKQNIHATISDVVCNLTFSTLQLILKLQEDAQSFLLLTSKKLAVECTEFDRIWADKERSGSSQIAFWRPRAPPGFAILGDCLTVIDEPPSKGVVALNMNLVHVKKPQEFKLLWSSNDGEHKCCVWLPVAPAGYVALGCVASVGEAPPSPNSALCVIKQLVTEWSMLDSIYVREEDWAFWRVDNSTGSFFPVSALREPHNCNAFELRQISLKHEKLEQRFAALEDSSAAETNQDSSQEENKLLLTTVARFKLIWWDKGAKSKKPVSIWRPVIPAGCVTLGDLAVEGYEPPSGGFVLQDTQDAVLLQKPLKFVKMGVIHEKKGLKPVTFWFPVSPPGFVALGCLASRGYDLDMEAGEKIRCVRTDLVRESQFPHSSLWDGSQVKRFNDDISIWPVQSMDTETNAATFVTNITREPPPKQLAFQLKDIGSHSDADSLAGDGVVKRFSATLFDDFGGMMAPLVNLSLEGITGSLHGTMDAMKSTANFSLCATTYNGRCDAWEPLIERVEGYVRFVQESSSPYSSESQVSLAATSDLNINATIANLNLLLEAYTSWNKLTSIESTSKDRNQAGKQVLQSEQEKKLQIVCHNKLGQNLYCRMLNEDSKVQVVGIQSGEAETFKIPTMLSLQDPYTSKSVRRKSVTTMFLQISNAQLPKDDGFGGRQYTVAVRLLPQVQTGGGQHQLHYQSARTRCVNPSENTSSGSVSVSWDESFLFEVDDKPYNVEILITDLAKGRTAGYSCISSIQEREKKADAGAFDVDLFARTESQNPIGRLRLIVKFFTVGGHIQEENLETVQGMGLDPGTIQVASSPGGPWTKLCLTLATKSSYLKIGSDAAASELRMEGGVKHLTINSLVTFKNNTGVTVDVSLFPHSPSQNAEQEASTIADEVFENERYQPVAGWGSSWPGHLLPLDPGRWSKRDLSGSSQSFPVIELPLGWEWSSDWYVDTAAPADDDGWGYAFSFKDLTGFPFTGNQKVSFVRRRRWIRTRQKTSSLDSARYVLGAVQPGESLPMPVACFREARQDYYLQLRPQDGSHYGWSQAILCQTHGQKKLPIQEINVRSLLSDHLLSTCLLESAATSASEKSMWFCLDLNYVDIGKDVYIGPVKECQLMLTAPLKIINHLPVSAEFKVYESSRIRGYRVQESGTVDSGGTAEVYNADVRKALYLSFSPQGAWQPVKELVLISHPFWDVAKYMVFENVSTKRRIKVHIEYDYEDEVTAKALRISVPFWIDCSKCPAMRLRVVDVEDRSKGACLPSVDKEEVLDDISNDELLGSYTMISPFAPKNSAMAASFSSSSGTDFGAASPLADLDQPDGTVEVVASDGKMFFRLLITTSLCPLKFAHTKVITVRPYITFTNRYGEALMLKQSSQDEPFILNTSAYRTSFPVSNINESLMLQIRLESSQWSSPLELKQEETLHLYLQDDKLRKHYIRVEVRSYQEGSKFVVVIRRGSFRGPYRLENRTAKRKLRFRQAGTSDENWEPLYPNSTKTFAWKNPHGEKLLEVLLDGLPAEKSFTVELDKINEVSTDELRVQVLQLQGVKLLRLSDADREEQSLLEEKPLVQSKIATSQLKVVLDIGKLGFSIVDQRPQEIFYLYLEGFKFSILMNSAENTSRYKVRVRYLQLDDQNILSTSSVILAPNVRGVAVDENVLKSTIIMLNDKEEGTAIYPYVGLWVTKKSWRVNVHEPVIWTAMGMYSNLQLETLASDSETVGADPEIRINLIDLSESRLKVTLQTEPGLRPRGALGIWSPLVSLAGNTSNMPIHFSGVTLENRYLRQSEVSTAVINHVRKDLVHQAFQLLFGVNVFGMASSTLETLSKSAADLSRDESFQKLRLKQDRLKHVSGVGDGLLRGGEALARGLAFGLSGVVKKPVDNARQHGFVGFFQGIGKAITGFVFQPISGVLDFIALTVDGVNVSYTRCFDVLSHDRTLTRIRLPRAIRGDGLLLPYDERTALGQAMLQLAEDHNFGQNVVFKEPAKFALSDFYEDHFEVPGNRVVMITNRRVMLLAQPTNYKSMKNVTPSNPCKILWEIPYMELLSLENARGQPSSYVILHLRNDPKTFAQVVKCSLENTPGTVSQADEVLSSIMRRWKKYGPDRRVLFSQMRKWQQSRSLPTPRASKRVFVSEEEIRSKRECDEERSYSGSSLGESFTKEVIIFEQIWRSELDSSVCCSTFSSTADSGTSCTIWRPIVPDGYVSIGDVAYSGNNPPTVTVSYKNEDGLFATPVGFDLVWRNWKDGYEPVTIWKPKAPEGYETLGFVAVAGCLEPEADVVWCARQDIVEGGEFEENCVWHVKHPWHCYIYQVHNDALTFFASREHKHSSHAAKRISR